MSSLVYAVIEHTLVEAKITFILVVYKVRLIASDDFWVQLDFPLRWLPIDINCYAIDGLLDLWNGNVTQAIDGVLQNAFYFRTAHSIN